MNIRQFVKANKWIIILSLVAIMLLFLLPALYQEKKETEPKTTITQSTEPDVKQEQKEEIEEDEPGNDDDEAAIEEYNKWAYKQLIFKIGGPLGSIIFNPYDASKVNQYIELREKSGCDANVYEFIKQNDLLKNNINENMFWYMMIMGAAQESVKAIVKYNPLIPYKRVVKNMCKISNPVETMLNELKRYYKTSDLNEKFTTEEIIEKIIQLYLGAPFSS